MWMQTREQDSIKTPMEPRGFVLKAPRTKKVHLPSSHGTVTGKYAESLRTAATKPPLLKTPHGKVFVDNTSVRYDQLGRSPTRVKADVQTKDTSVEVGVQHPSHDQHIE
jgi:hypothetical protein